MIKRLLFSVPFLLLLIFYACEVVGDRFIDEDEPIPVSPTGEPLDSSRNVFNYETTQAVSVSINSIYPYVQLNFKKDGAVVTTLTTNGQGMIETSLSLPGYYETISLETHHVGLPSLVTVKIVDNTISFDYNDMSRYDNLVNKGVEPTGPSFSYSGNTIPGDYNFLGGWNPLGKPQYLEKKRDKISKETLRMIDAALPEKKPVPDYNPHYIADTSQVNLVLQEEAGVYVTFVHEGAGYLNTLGFYTYNVEDGPPAELSKDEITIIFPNVSYPGGGGALHSGDKVKIGTFPGGTVVGWVLIANGYSRRSSRVGNGLNRFHSDASLNPETGDNAKHVVLLEYAEEELFILSFEDLLRPYGDNDFNDAVFYVTTDPAEAVDRSGVLSISDSNDEVDSDNDGYPDEVDDAPTDANVVSIIRTPGEGTGTLAYEDLWPYRGDYDFNDLVINYVFNEHLNADGEIVKLTGSFIVKGILASMRNGFAIQLPISSNLVSSVTGGEFSRGYMDRTANGVERRQALAVIGVFENANLHYDSDGEGEPVIVEIEFTRPLSRSELSFPPFNPFIISNGERGREVHLPGKQSTSLAHYEYFGWQDDRSIPGTTETYKAENGKPWALHLPESFIYPYDSIAIEDAYSYFEDWVLSKGTEHKDWYTDETGHRNRSKLIYW